MASTTSDKATAALSRERDGDYRFNLTADELAASLHARMAGKTVLITGVSPSSLGAEAARVVAAHSPKLLILASRTRASIEEVVAGFPAGQGAGAGAAARVVALQLDLASQASVRAAAAEALRLAGGVVDVLVNNAAVMMVPDYATTPEGVELQFGTNHVGHFLLTNLLMPALLASPAGARVVNVTSSGHRASGVRFGDVNFGDGKDYDLFLAYAQSKTANLLFTLGLAMKLGKTKLRAYSVDPGSINTGLKRYIPEEELVTRGWFLENGEPNPAIPWKTPAQSVASYVMAAYDPEIEDKNGACIAAAAVDSTVEGHALDPDAAEKLWKLSEELVGQKFEY